MALDEGTLKEAYRKMVLVRTMEDTHGRLLQEGKIQLMGHFGTGQEAVAIGVSAPLRQEDILFGTHRGVGEFVGKGMSISDIWLEYLGKKTSPTGGKGALHLADKKHNIPGIVSSLGADFSMAVGAALASKLQKKDQVTLYFVGEGTCNQADAHPSMNMAALWKLPLVFAVCTNQFCELSYMREYYTTEDVAPRAQAYNIPSEIVDGQDIEATYQATQRALEHAGSGKGPYLVEYKTFRMAGHFTGDPAGYVDPEERARWAQRDPLDLAKAKLLERGIMSEEEDQALRQALQAEVDQAAEQAMAAPDPVFEDLYTNVWALEEVC